ncbi:MAG: hypothetical protein V5A55_10130 [Halovenus sp.]
MEAIAINIGANTNEPGFRGPVWPDGSFEYIPIPESEPTASEVPTYGDLAPTLSTEIPAELRATPVHLDPEFPGYPFCERYTYGDEHGVKAGPLSTLSAGDYVFFYATLTVAEPTAWLPPTWGAFLVGHFKLARDPVTAYRDLPEAEREPFDNNAHVKRDPFDARVLLLGQADSSRLYERAVPLSRPSGGTDPNWLVTDCSDDSGRGPWWRRPLGFDAPELLEATDGPPPRTDWYQPR